MYKIAVVGAMRSGKGTVCDYIMSKNKRIYDRAIAQPIKDLVEHFLPNLTAPGQPKPREAYQLIGEAFRKFNPEVWLEQLDKFEQNIEYDLDPYAEGILINDCRLKVEADWLRSRGYFIIKVETDETLRMNRLIDSGEKFNPIKFYHPTEMEVQEIRADYTLTNNSTIDDLRDQVDDMFEYYRCMWIANKNYEQLLKERGKEYHER